MPRLPRKVLPDWVERYRTEGHTIREKDGKYYLIRVFSVYDPKKTYPVKKEEHIGTITKDKGLIKKSDKILFTDGTPYSLQYGASCVISKLSEDIKDNLFRYFGELGNWIYYLAMLRTIEHTALRQAQSAFDEHYLSIENGKLNYSGTIIAENFRIIGREYEKALSFMKEYVTASSVVIFDGTNIVCNSKDITYGAFGYAHGHEPERQFNLMLGFAVDSKMPVFTKLFEGSIRDCTVFPEIIEEMELKDACAIADKGFASSKIFEAFAETTKYIIPLHRNSQYVTDEVKRDLAREKYSETFFYLDRLIYAYKVYTDDKKQIYTFIDEDLRKEEISNYRRNQLNNKSGYTDADFQDSLPFFGMLVIQTNLDKTGMVVYEMYKLRNQVEVMVDTLKNTYEYDVSFMRSDLNAIAWSFVNHITLMMVYRVYNALRKADLLKSYSPLELFRMLRKVQKHKNITAKVNANGTENYKTSLVPAQVAKLLTKMGLSIV